MAILKRFMKIMNTYNIWDHIIRIASKDIFPLVSNFLLPYSFSFYFSSFFHHIAIRSNTSSLKIKHYLSHYTGRNAESSELCFLLDVLDLINSSEVATVIFMLETKIISLCHRVRSYGDSVLSDENCDQQNIIGTRRTEFWILGNF